MTYEDTIPYREYPKIQTLWKRDPATNHKSLLEGQWALPEFEYMKDLPWEMYEKVDGTNIRVIFYPELHEFDEEVEFRGRSDKAQIPTHLLEELKVLFDAGFFRNHFDLDRSGDAPITLYGEGFGPKIQKGGGNYGARPDFCLFDIRIGTMWMPQAFVSELAEQASLQRAPLLAIGELELAIYKTRQGFSSTWGDFPAEGLIVRPRVDLFTRSGSRVIGKIKTRDFIR